jgi:Lrp/AsnC family transcriptional regulator, regulator for asnA, asnC and gidA
MGKLTTDSLANDVVTREYRGVTTRERSNHVLDDVSKRIIEQLQEDGRRPYAAIGKAVGLSEAAVRQRVQRLLDAGVMQIVAVTDPLQVGFNRQAMIGVRAEGDLKAVADALAAMPEVDYVVITAGSFDLLAEAVCEDDDDLLNIVSSRIRTIPGVRSTETFVYLKLRKQLYNWGTR